jgi:hypothetical protein
MKRSIVDLNDLLKAHKESKSLDPSVDEKIVLYVEGKGIVLYFIVILESKAGSTLVYPAKMRLKRPFTPAGKRFFSISIISAKPMLNQHFPAQSVG